MLPLRFGWLDLAKSKALVLIRVFSDRDLEFRAKARDFHSRWGIVFEVVCLSRDAESGTRLRFERHETRPAAYVGPNSYKKGNNRAIVTNWLKYVVSFPN